MGNSKLLKSLVASVLIVSSLVTIYGLAAASRPASPPSTIQVEMNALTEGGGSIITLGGTPATCSTPDNQVRWGCTAFYQPTINSTPPPATVVAYPYGSTAAPQVALESDYLKNVVPAEMSVSIAPQAALEAQAIAARSYAWNKIGDLNNSTSRQVFVPYRFEFYA